jgi:hypothetical protein
MKKMRVMNRIQCNTASHRVNGSFYHAVTAAHVAYRKLQMRIEPEVQTPVDDLIAFNTNVHISALYYEFIDAALIRLDGAVVDKSHKCSVFQVHKNLRRDWLAWNTDGLRKGTIVAKVGLTTGITFGYYEGIAWNYSNNDEI